MNIYALFKKRKATPQVLTPVEIQPPPSIKKTTLNRQSGFFVS